MVDAIQIYCPHCGEVNDLDVEVDALGEMIQDCEVCCKPMRLVIRRDEWGDPDVTVAASE